MKIKKQISVNFEINLEEVMQSFISRSTGAQKVEMVEKIIKSINLANETMVYKKDIRQKVNEICQKLNK